MITRMKQIQKAKRSRSESQSILFIALPYALLCNHHVVAVVSPFSLTFSVVVAVVVDDCRIHVCVCESMCYCRFSAFLRLLRMDSVLNVIQNGTHGCSNSASLASKDLSLVVGWLVGWLLVCLLFLSYQ